MWTAISFRRKSAFEAFLHGSSSDVFHKQHNRKEDDESTNNSEKIFNKWAQAVCIHPKVQGVASQLQRPDRSKAQNATAIADVARNTAIFSLLVSGLSWDLNQLMIEKVPWQKCKASTKGWAHDSLPHQKKSMISLHRQRQR